MDRDPNYTALFIVDICEESINDYGELQCLKEYQSLWDEYNFLLSKMHREFSGRITLTPQEKEEMGNQISYFYHELRKLEASSTMQNLLRRERNGNVGKITEEEYMQHKISILNKAYKITNLQTKKQVPPQENTRGQVQKFILIPLLLSLLFFISTFKMPYGFYQFARIVVFFLSIIHLYIWHKHIEKFSLKFIPIIAIAILWNPIMPIYLDKVAWVILDILAIVTEIIVSILLYRTTKNE